MANVRNWLLRHLARRMHIGEDILRHLSTFQRLGETLEIEAPQEMLPVGARTLIRALRSRAAPQIRPDWVWPYWLEQQLDPRSPSFVPRGMIALTQNLTHRNWTAVGNLWSSWEAIVDPRGLVTPWFDGWSVDWWVLDGDEWRYPSRDEHVEQRLVGAAPVVETAMPVGQGAVVHRAYGQVDRTELVTVELDNHTGRDLQVAFALRPYNPEGLAVVEDVRIDGDLVFVEDDHLALLLPGAPRQVALSVFHEGDAAQALRRGTIHQVRTAVHDTAGLATAAFVYQLPAGDTLRAASPMVPGAEQDRSVTERAGALRGRAPQLRSGAEIADTWKSPLERGMRVELPDPAMQEAVDANRAFLLLLHDPGSITPGPFTYHRFWFRDAAYMSVALDRWGMHEEAADVLASFPGRQRADGFFYSQWREWDANGSAIWAIAEHHRLTGDTAFLSRFARSVDRGARWIMRKPKERRRDDEILHGLLPAGVSAEHLGPFDYYYWDDFWSMRGLLDAGYVADVLGADEAATDFRTSERRLRTDVMRSIDLASRRLGRQAIPAGPRRGADAGMIGSLAACEPLRLVEADDPLMVGTVDLIRERFCHGPAFFHGIAHTGFGTYLTLQLAYVELEQHDPRCWERLRWLADAATPTWTWPEAIHPRLGGGCMGDGHHGWALADFLSFIRQVLVRERSDGRGLELLGVLPPEWRGEPLAVHDAPTHHGTVSYRVRWEDDNPVLTWFVRDPSDAFELRAPGLDPDWVTAEPSGEVRLRG